MVRAHARTFYLASRFLPREKRRAAFAIYAFCRTIDDVADADAPAPERRSALAAHEAALHCALAGDPRGPVHRELVHALQRFGIPHGALFELVAGVARDTGTIRHTTWHELADYCAAVASTVGELCTHVFGVAPGATVTRAVRYARTLGVAMQLTNILRDVGEDAARGRCYLPDDDLALFGLTRDEVLGSPRLGRDERWRPFMAYEIGRARMIYEAALPGIALLAGDARRCALACAVGYAGILGAIERVGYDTVTHRASPTTLERASVLWRVARHRFDAPALARGPILPSVPAAAALAAAAVRVP